MSNYILSRTGKYISLTNPEKDMISIRAIVSALPVINRFAGNFDDMYRFGMDFPFYSVAQHSVIASKLVEPKYAMELMAHDMPEAYINDISSPLRKVIGSSIEDVDNGIYKLIAEKLELPDVLSKEAKSADAAMAFFERKMLMPQSDEFELDQQLWDYCREHSERFPAPDIIPVDPFDARVMFVDRLEELMGSSKLENMISDTPQLRLARNVGVGNDIITHHRDEADQSFAGRVSNRLFRYTSDETALTAAWLSDVISCRKDINTIDETGSYVLSDINQMFHKPELIKMIDDVVIHNPRSMQSHFGSIAQATPHTQLLKACMIMEQVPYMIHSEDHDRFLDYADNCLKSMNKIPQRVKQHVEAELATMGFHMDPEEDNIDTEKEKVLLKA